MSLNIRLPVGSSIRIFPSRLVLVFLAIVTSCYVISHFSKDSAKFRKYPKF